MSAQPQQSNVVLLSQYRRILLKLSGEALGGDLGSGFDAATVEKVTHDIYQTCRLGVEICVVVGGGNFVRGRELTSRLPLDRSTADTMGMIATAINGLALQNTLEKKGLPCVLMSAIPMQGVCEAFDKHRADALLKAGTIVICVAGSGNPFFTTDTCAALRAVETRSQVIMKATKVKGVYTSDPVKNPDAKFLPYLTMTEALEKGYQVMDMTAFTIAKENKIPIAVFAMREADSLQSTLQNKSEFSFVTPS